MHTVTATGRQLSPEEYKEMSKLLEERFYTTDYTDFSLAREGNRYVVSVQTTDTLSAAMKQLDFFLGSSEVGIYEAANAADPVIKAWLDSLVLPQAAQRMDLSPQNITNNALLLVDDDLVALTTEAVHRSLPDTGKYAMFWSTLQQSHSGGKGQRTLYLYKKGVPGGPVLTNAEVASAKIEENPQTGEAVIIVSLTYSAAETFTAMTTAASADNNRPVGIVINDEVWTNPSVREPITGGNLWITTGPAQLGTIDRIVRQLPWNPLPADLIVQSRKIVPVTE